MRVRSWIKTVPSLAIIGSVLFLVLTVGGTLLLWGANFADNMVHNQLSEQKISSIDMVTSTFLTIAQVRDKKAGAVLAVSDECLHGKFGFRDPLFFAAEQKTIDVARKALQFL